MFMEFRPEQCIKNSVTLKKISLHIWSKNMVMTGLPIITNTQCLSLKAMTASIMQFLWDLAMQDMYGQT